MPTPAPVLLADCRRLVATLTDDLRRLLDDDPAAQARVRAELDAARRAGRTSLAETDWLEGRLAQVAVAWVLAGVFIRFCEDNGLLDGHRLGGTGPGLQEAKDRRAAHLRAHPDHDDRHWLDEVIAFAAGHQGLDAVLGAHNPLRFLPLSADGARAFVQFWQEQEADGSLRRDFTDRTWDTRFLGDLYQDLSDHAKKTYALLQTPVFVEEFILDHTLTPALQEFGLADTTVIDPTCGSGHFLLGAFDRLAAAWADRAPGTDRRVLAQRALDQIAGVDLNPFAVAIARFRLVVAAMRFEGVGRLADAPEYRLRVATGDSLYHFQVEQRLGGTADVHGYAVEDVDEVMAILRERYAVVVGNPPYITVKDPAMNELYRKRFSACHRQYSLGVPFTQQFVRLARTGTSTTPAGYVGMITANSFMKREFGKKLVEEFLPTQDLTHVIDTSGAYIPGHGTPTVILFLRHRRPTSETVQAVLGIRGEPSKPQDPTKGVVWRSIVELLPEGEAENDYVTVTRLPRARLAKHPWSIGGGGAAELKERLDRRAGTPLGRVAEEIGFGAVTREDDVFIIGEGPLRRAHVEPRSCLPFVEGDRIRDWDIVDPTMSIWPYDPETLTPSCSSAVEQQLWPYRTQLSQRIAYGKTQIERGLPWWSYSMFFEKRFRTPLSIAFAFVATHNHFVLDRGGKVFNRSAPVIKLPAGASVDDHLGLVGLLNSSTACFWMQQVFHNKGGPGGASSKDEKWHDFYEHDGTKLQAFPLTRERPVELARQLDGLAGEAADLLPGALARRTVPTRAALDDARATWESTRRQMIALQEELDWQVYGLYGLLDDPPLAAPDDVPEVALGERAFEIVLARKVAAGEVDTAWFTRHRSTPVTEIPARWPEAYRSVVQQRIDLIETNPDIALIEQPQYKRRWAVTPWEDAEREALRTWLADRLEAPGLWEPPLLATCASLANRLRTDADFVAVAELLGGRGADLTVLVTDLVTAEAVPYLAAERYTDTGLRKRAEWERVWELQRREDAGEDVGPIPVPPKYTKADFRGAAWEHRGKLDVPKERFVSYPGLGRPGDPSPVVGWAGWDHLQRAQALMAWYHTLEPGDRDRALRVLAGLAELLPWVRQWHDTPADDHAGTALAHVLDAELARWHVTFDDLRALPPAAGTRRARTRTTP